MHTIRLRGPWRLEPIARFTPQADGTLLPAADDLPPPVQAKMPADWSAALGDDFLGRVRYHRVFQSPTGLDEGQRVWLVVEPPLSYGQVHLADELLGEVRHGQPAARFDITFRLEEHNRLEIVVEHPSPGVSLPSAPAAGGLVGLVRLEIEE